MKRVLNAVFCAALMAMPLVAQTSTPAPQSDANAGTPSATQFGHRGHGRRRAFAMGHMLGKLNLTDAQKSQLKPMFQQQRQQAQAIRQDQSLTDEQKQAKLKDLRQNFQSQLNGVLTPEQQQQLAQFREQHKPALAQLNLTDAQKTQLKPIFQQQHQQARSIWQDSTLTPEQKRDKMKALHQQTDAQLQGILTPEQQQQFQQLQSQRHHGHRHHGADAPPAETTPQPQG